MSASLYISVRVSVCACIVCTQNNKSLPNMKGGVHCVYVFGAWGNHIQCHKEETGRSQPLSKQAGAEQLRLLTAELWIYRKT